MTTQKYILKGKKLVKVDVLTWAQWFETADRKIGFDVIGEKQVSTVFLGIDYNYSSKGKPLLFETVVFPKGELVERYSTWGEAEAGHKKAIEELKKKL